MGSCLEDLVGAIAGVFVGFGVIVLITLFLPEAGPGNEFGSLAPLFFCGFPIWAIGGAALGVWAVRRRRWRGVSPRGEIPPPRRRQRPYQRRDGSF